MLAWVDVETTGLDPRGGSLLEVGIILTDDNLNEYARTSVVLEPPLAYEWTLKPEVLTLHDAGGGNSLLAECEAHGLPRERAQSQLTRWLSARVGNERPPMAGSTVGFDRAWLKAKMPRLEALFHYRSVDVSTLKELNARWDFAPVWEGKRNTHRALPDLEDSIAELRHYRQGLVVRPGLDDPWVRDEWGGPQ